MPVSIDLQPLKDLRQEIHSHPELSGEEKETSERIRAFVSKYSPDNIKSNIGGYGLIASFLGKESGPSVMIRAELDALPIEEINDFFYKSNYKNKGHKCGHDGHMTMVASLARLLSEDRPRKGEVHLLFQPSEETGEGSQQMLQDEAFSSFNIDYCFALHNLPGFDKNTIVLKDNIFASASKGMIISLDGKTSHAAEPANGISPSKAVGNILQELESLPESADLTDFGLITVVHTLIGEKAFGTTPGHATIMATLRAYHDSDLMLLEGRTKELCTHYAGQYGLKIDFDETEVFSATLNDQECANMIRKAADSLNLRIDERHEPFRWSEDFGLFTQKYKGAMFGLGAGKDTSSLHNPDYDFPDDIMPSGINMFHQLIKQLIYS